VRRLCSLWRYAHQRERPQPRPLSPRLALAIRAPKGAAAAATAQSTARFGDTRTKGSGRSRDRSVHGSLWRYARESQCRRAPRGGWHGGLARSASLVLVGGVSTAFPWRVPHRRARSSLSTPCGHGASPRVPPGASRRICGTRASAIDSLLSILSDRRRRSGARRFAPDLRYARVSSQSSPTAAGRRAPTTPTGSHHGVPPLRLRLPTRATRGSARAPAA